MKIVVTVQILIPLKRRTNAITQRACTEAGVKHLHVCKQHLSLLYTTKYIILTGQTDLRSSNRPNFTEPFALKRKHAYVCV